MKRRNRDANPWETVFDWMENGLEVTLCAEAG